MKIKVKYQTEFGIRTTEKDFKDLLHFSKRFKIVSQEIINKLT